MSNLIGRSIRWYNTYKDGVDGQDAQIIKSKSKIAAALHAMR